MEKRNIIYSDSELEEEPQPVMVRLVLLKQVNLKTVGKVTGTVYHFPGAGSQVDVDERDVQHLMSRISVSCCTGNTNSPYFDIVR